MLAASYVRLGRVPEAKDVVRRLLEIRPRFRIESVRNIALGRARRVEAILSALREAGLPE